MWLLWGGVRGCSLGACVVAPGGGHAWDTTRYGDTVNERAVRILLECILVIFLQTSLYCQYRDTYVHQFLSLEISSHRSAYSQRGVRPQQGRLTGRIQIKVLATLTV